MSNLDEIIADIMYLEGGAIVSNDPDDSGGRTQYGISERSNPQAWLDGKVTEKEAKEIYLQRYVIFPKWHTIPPSHQLVQRILIDWSVISGPYLVTNKLQQILSVRVDGVFGPKTLAAMVATDVKELNNKLVAERIKMIGRIVSSKPSQAKFCLGWLSRALEFLA